MQERWSVSINDLQLNKRTDGISGFIRARNEEDWLALTIESHLLFLDEIIIVYNRCTDKTPEIANFYAKKCPDKIKAYHFAPEVFAQGTKKCQDLPPTSEHSLVNYYNYALCKTTRKIALKVDGDQIAIPSVYKQMVEYVKKCKPLIYYYTFRGINLWDKDGKVFILYRADDTPRPEGWGRTCRIGLAYSNDGRIIYAKNDWELQGFTPVAVVANGMVYFKGQWLLYYGAADHWIGIGIYDPDSKCI
jgi:glycosyltransferase involved in cell wall biosynthesis